MPTSLKVLKSNALIFYEKHETRLAMVFFVAGFLLDVFTLSEIDDTFSLIQQFLYLVVIAGFLFWELKQNADTPIQSPTLQKLWNYRNLIVHFLLGSLLSVYSLFYFKSSSMFNSFLFIGLLFFLMIANEFQRVQTAGLWVKISLWVISVISFFSICVSILLGFIGYTAFFLTLICMALLFYFLYKKIHSFQSINLNLKKQIYTPALSTVFAFILFYFLGFIPPIPLSAQYMGIYHDIQKKDGQYYLYHYNPKWKFWNHGDQNFYAHPEDKIYFFTNIYSPARFSDEVYVRWAYYDEAQGWQAWDRIPMKISGGRSEGFRGYTYKSKFAYGDWRVYLETTDGREIGRISFTVYENTNEQHNEQQLDIR